MLGPQPSMDMLRGMRLGIATGAAAVRIMNALKACAAIFMCIALTTGIAAIDAHASLSRVRDQPFDQAVMTLRTTMSEAKAREAAEAVRLRVAEALAELRRVELMMPLVGAHEARRWIAEEAAR